MIRGGRTRPSVEVSGKVPALPLRQLGALCLLRGCPELHRSRNTNGLCFEAAYPRNESILRSANSSLHLVQQQAVGQGVLFLRRALQIYHRQIACQVKQDLSRLGSGGNSTTGRRVAEFRYNKAGREGEFHTTMAMVSDRPILLESGKLALRATVRAEQEIHPPPL